MLAEHRAAYSAALYGLIAIALFLAPLFIYSGEYSDNEKQGRGNKAGDIFSMVSQGLGIHVALLFFFAVGFQIIDLIMTPVPSLKPSEALKTFFMIDGGAGANEFIKGWMHNSWAGTATGGAPMNEVAQKSFGIFMTAVGIALTLLFIGIPLMILTTALKITLTPDPQQQDAPVITSLISGGSFYIGATLLIMVHSLIASSLVMLMTNTSGFSYWEAMQKIWSYILFGGY